MKVLTFYRALFAALVIAIAAPAAATTLQEAMSELSSAKAEGLVGEQQDGYLGVVKAEGDAEEIVRLINEARRKEYTRIAGENEIAVADVEALAGKRAIEKTASGHHVRVDGQWMRKP